MKFNEKLVLGIEAMKRKKWKVLFIPVYLLMAFLLWNWGMDYIPKVENNILTYMYVLIYHSFSFLLVVLGMLALIMGLGNPSVESLKIKKNLIKARFVDENGEAPLMFLKKNQGHGVIYEFFSERFTLEDYKKATGKLQIALNIKVIEIIQGKDMRYVLVKGIPVDSDIKETRRWKHEYLNEKDFLIKLGENYLEDEYLDLNQTYHVLIGGGTGSGKSTLLKLILFQCVLKGANVIIGDFKGAVDYKKIWYEKCCILTEQEEFIKKLEEVYGILKERQTLFCNQGVSKITEYNEKNSVKMQRIIVVCDEFTQVLNKKEKDKNKLNMNMQVESYLERITSLGRAFGIHVILSTQRPDSDVIDGKIKGNLGYRVCGRADSILSKIIIDNTDAADMISQKDEGFFITNMHSIFKAYYFEDDMWKEV